MAEIAAFAPQLELQRGMKMNEDYPVLVEKKLPRMRRYSTLGAICRVRRFLMDKDRPESQNSGLDALFPKCKKRIIWIAPVDGHAMVEMQPFTIYTSRETKISCYRKHEC